MDVIRGDGTLLQEIDLAPENVHQEVIQNIAVILDLIQKSCPMFRDGGLPGELIGRPMNVVESILVGSIYDQIEEIRLDFCRQFIPYLHRSTAANWMN